MTRKHLIALAACIKEAQRYNPWQSIAAAEAAALMRRTIARNLADTCALENPRFDRARFLTACGVDAQCQACDCDKPQNCLEVQS